MWNALILYPFTNALLLLYSVVGNSFTLAIVIFTVLIRLVTIPLTVWAQKNQQRMTEMQPVMKKIQEDYKDQPDKMQAKLAEEGFGPTTMLGGCLPMLLQFPIMIGLYQSITHVMAVSPLTLIDLYHAIYPIFPNFDQLIPVNNHFFWLNLALPDPYYVLPALVVATTWLSQQMVTPAPSGDGGQAAEMARSMSLSTTVVFGFMSLQFASGLSIYFVVSNLATAVQYAWTNEYQRKRIIAFLNREKISEAVQYAWTNAYQRIRIIAFLKREKISEPTANIHDADTGKPAKVAGADTNKKNKQRKHKKHKQRKHKKHKQRARIVE